MDFDDYQKKAEEFAIYANPGEHYKLMYLGMGLAGEVGEVVEKVKKIIRPTEITVTPEVRDDLKKEMGDVVWYLSQLALALGIPFKDIATYNIDKLTDRKKRGVIHSKGDNR